VDLLHRRHCVVREVALCHAASNRNDAAVFGSQQKRSTFVVLGVNFIVLGEKVKCLADCDALCAVVWCFVG
jgi:hypothetical protein